MVCLKRSVSQTFTSSSSKKVFPKSVYHWCILLRWMFFILCDIWKQYFWHKFIFIQRLGITDMFLRSLKQMFRKESVFYVRYLHNNIAMILMPKHSKWSFYFLNFFKKIYIFADSVFLHSLICKSSTLSFINWIFKTQVLLGGMFLIRSCNQVFMTCICSHKLLNWKVISENKNTEYLTPIM